MDTGRFLFRLRLIIAGVFLFVIIITLLAYYLVPRIYSSYKNSEEVSIQMKE